MIAFARVAHQDQAIAATKTQALAHVWMDFGSAQNLNSSQVAQLRLQQMLRRR